MKRKKRTPEERAAELVRREELTRQLRERIEYHQARADREAQKRRARS